MKQFAKQSEQRYKFLKTISIQLHASVQNINTQYLYYFTSDDANLAVEASRSEAGTQRNKVPQVIDWDCWQEPFGSRIIVTYVLCLQTSKCNTEYKYFRILIIFQVQSVGQRQAGRITAEPGIAGRSHKLTRFTHILNFLIFLNLYFLYLILQTSNTGVPILTGQYHRI